MTSSTHRALRLSVIGTGYLGATHAVCMASLGYDVIALDVDAAKIDRLRAGEIPFHEPELPELLAKVLPTGRLTFTTSFEEVAANADVHFVCVGTPQLPGSPGADMQYVDAAVESLAPYLTGPSIVVGKSTVPVGTAARLASYLKDNAPGGADVELVWNPEFLREGFAVKDTLEPDRLVLGVASEHALEQMREVYRPILDLGTPLVVTDYPTAELVKTAANAFLATKISFINAMAEICEVVDADVSQLATAIGYDNRIGSRFLRAGVGFGGGCLPKDIRAFHTRASELGAGESVAFLHEVDKINLRRRARVVELVHRELGSVQGKKLAVWGAAFKPDSDDIRDSPALDIARKLAEEGAEVVLYDPEAMTNAKRVAPTLGYADSLVESVDNVDAIVLLTEWKEFVHVDPVKLAGLVSNQLLIDGRNAVDGVQWLDAGFTYVPLGKPALRPTS